MRRAIAILFAAAACSSGPPRPPMSDAERTYRAKCTSCHRVYEPREQTPKQWVATLDKMEALKKVTLSAEERAEILQYLTGTTSPLR